MSKCTAYFDFEGERYYCEYAAPHVGYHKDTSTTEWKDVVEGAGYMNEPDPINPSHYKLANGAEVISITENLNFCRGNAVKYICRAGQKDTAKELEDLKKALWYLDKEMDRLKGQKPDDD